MARYAPGGYAAVSECLDRSCRLDLDRVIYFPNGRGKFGIHRESRKICFWPRTFLTERKISLACCARWTINSVKNACKISSDFEGRVRMSSGKKSEAKTGQNAFNRQTDRQTNRQADRQTDIYANRHDTRARSTIVHTYTQRSSFHVRTINHAGGVAVLR